MRKGLFLLGLLFSCITIDYSKAQEKSDITITHGPYLQNVTQTGATVIFNSNKLIVPGILIRPVGGEFKLIQNSHEGLVDVGDNIHKVRLDHLQPGKEYEYRLFACEIIDYLPYKCTFGDTLISEIYKFKTFTSERDPINFTVFCDIHDRAAKLGQYLDHNEIEKQDCYFLNGDIMGHIEEEQQLFSSFLDTCVSRFATEKPFFYVRGNHETRGKFARQLINYLDFAENTYYFAQTIGPVRFVVLDGGEDKPDTSTEYSGLVDFDSYRYKELEWLKREVEGNEFQNAPFKVVIIHMPIIENEKNWYGMSFLAQHFGPVLKEAGIDLMISGHTHRNAWIDSDKSGFGYPVLISSNNHFVEAMADEKKISLVLKDINGKVVEEYNCINYRGVY